jgi:hypothetical protein
MNFSPVKQSLTVNILWQLRLAPWSVPQEQPRRKFPDSGLIGIRPSKNGKKRLSNSGTVQLLHFRPLQSKTLLLVPPTLCRFSLFTMSATKAQSQKIFEKLKTKPANKVRFLSGLCGLSATSWLSLGMFWLRLQEPNLVFRSFRNLPVPGLFSQPQKPGSPHLLCSINYSR